LAAGSVLLGFELVRQDQVGLRGERPVSRYHVLGHVEPAVIPHDGIKNPEETAGRRRGLFPQLLPNGPDSLHSRRAGDIPREHHVELIQIRLLQALEQGGDLVRGHPRAFPLSVAGVVASTRGREGFMLVSDLFSSNAASLFSMYGFRGCVFLYPLNWTVFRADTSQPRDCSTKTAILFPTFLKETVCQAMNSNMDRLGKATDPETT
jgi:hypothetical protein